MGKSFFAVALPSVGLVLACGGKAIDTGAHAGLNDRDGGAIPVGDPSGGSTSGRDVGNSDLPPGNSPPPGNAPPGNAPPSSTTDPMERPPPPSREPVSTCGNGRREGGETCDGRDLNGETCASVTMNARVMGELGCSSACTFDLSGCRAPAVPPSGVGGTWGAGGTWYTRPPIWRRPPPGVGGSYGR